MKTISENKTPATLAERVVSRLGEARLAKLAAQPMCIAREGGMETILAEACAECAGFPEPGMAAAVRVLQLCGSHAKPEDLIP